MAKGSLFWGNGRGKLGQAVFYRAGGEQRARMYVSKIKNPKTLAQVSNRLSMANFSALYRQLKSILSQSFTLRKANQSGFNAFVSKNKTVNSPVNSKGSLNNGYVAMDGFIVSDGTLLSDKQYARNDEYIGFVIANKGDNEVLDAFFGSASNVSRAINLSGEQLSSVFEQIGLTQKAVVTCLMAVYMDEGWKVYMDSFNVGKGTSSAMGNYPDLKLMQVPSETGGNTQIWLGMEGLTPDAQVLGAVVVSDRDAAGKLLATNSSFLLTDADDEYISQFKPNGFVWEQVLNQMGYNSNSVLVSDGVVAIEPESGGEEEVG